MNNFDKSLIELDKQLKRRPITKFAGSVKEFRIYLQKLTDKYDARHRAYQEENEND